MLNLRVFRILIAAPGDCQKERDEMVRELQAWNLTYAEQFNAYLWPWRYEENSYASSGREGQAEINNQLITRADYCVAFFRHKLGTPTSGYESGTVEEIDRCLKRGLQVSLQFLDDGMPAPAGVTKKEIKRLQAYRKTLQDPAAKLYYQRYDGVGEGVSKAMNAVAAWVIRHTDEVAPDSSADSEKLERPSALIPSLDSLDARLILDSNTIHVMTQQGTRRITQTLSGMQGLVRHDWRAEVNEMETDWELKNTSGLTVELKRCRVVADHPGSRIAEVLADDAPAVTLQPNETFVIEDLIGHNPGEMQLARVRVEYVVEGVFLEGEIELEADRWIRDEDEVVVGESD